jgi:two-component system, OmpR family, sensor histidine kinase MprB
MSFRRRMVLLAAGAVAAAVVLASVVVYVVTGNELRGQIDASLRQKLTPGQPQSVQIKTTKLNPSERAKLEKAAGVLARTKAAGALARTSKTLNAGPLPNIAYRGTVSTEEATEHGSVISIHKQGKISVPSPPVTLPNLRALEPSSAAITPGLALFRSVTHGPGGAGTAISVVLPPQGFGGASGYAQLTLPGGHVLDTGGLRALPITAATRAVASGRRPAFFSDVTVAGTPERVFTERAPGDSVWQVALPLTDVNSTLRRLLLVLGAVSLGGVLLAATLGLLVSRAALIPVRRLMGATERVARTQDLAHRIPAGGEDELGRLAASFNTMLATLERSRLAQRQLVSDASHELRTPLTSVQANLDALAMGEELPARERAPILAAAQAQLRELTVLVGDLVDLSKTEVQEVEVEDVRLDLAAAGAIKRTRLHAPECHFLLDAEPCLVRAAPARLDRAIANLLDNACKWNPPIPPAGRAGDPIEVRVRSGVLEVRDHGSGIAAEDLPRVFDRFYRAPGARARPGSGLGLAIVRQMAEAHGGAVHAANDPDGGARLTLELPALQMTDAELAASQGDAPAASGVV